MTFLTGKRSVEHDDEDDENDDCKLVCNFVTCINSARFWESSCHRFSTLCRILPDLV